MVSIRSYYNNCKCMHALCMLVCIATYVYVHMHVCCVSIELPRYEEYLSNNYVIKGHVTI